MEAEATGLIEEGGRVTGVRATPGGRASMIRADLVIGADGRRSAVRAAAGLAVRNLGAPIDVLWMRMSAAHRRLRAAAGASARAVSWR